MEQLFPGASDAILTTVGNLEAAETIYLQAIEEKKRKYLRGSQIDIEALSAEKEAATVLFEILRPLGFTYTQVRDILAVPMASGCRYFSTNGTTMAEQNRGILDIGNSSRLSIAGDSIAIDPGHDITSPIHIMVSRGNIAAFHPEGQKATVAFFDASAVDSGNALWELRHPQRGDRMVPFGSRKSKLLSDIFNNAKYSAAQKREAWVLTRDGVIVWLPGLRNSAECTVGPGTKEFIRMEIKQ